MKNVMKKLKSSAGFTLAETLMTVLILVMVAGVVAGGMPSALNAHSKAVDAANAHVLISTTVNALRSELSTARDVHLNADGDVIYISTSTGSKAKLYKEKDEKGNDVILVQDFLKYDESGSQGGEENKARRLVTESAVTKSLQVTYASVGWEKKDEVLAFNGLEVKKGDTTVEKIEELYIRCLGVNLTEPEAPAGS